MTKVKLGPKAASFSDPVSGLLLAKGEEKELPPGPHSWILKEALKGGHIEVIKEEKITPPPELTREEKLAELTRNDLMVEFGFIDDDHRAIAEKKKTKAEALEYLLSIEGDYIRKRELLLLTRDELMEKFDFIDEDHRVEAEEKETKEEALEYLLSIEGEYADD